MGVTYNTQKKCWIAYVKDPRQKKQVHLGCFPSTEEGRAKAEEAFQKAKMDVDQGIPLRTPKAQKRTAEMAMLKEAVRKASKTAVTKAKESLGYSMEPTLPVQTVSIPMAVPMSLPVAHSVIGSPA